MKKFANISSVYMILSIFTVVFLNPFLLLSSRSFFNDKSPIVDIAGFFSVVIGIVLLIVGFYLRKKLKNDSKQLANVKQGIRFSVFHIGIFLFIIIPALICAYLDSSLFCAHLD